MNDVEPAPEEIAEEEPKVAEVRRMIQEHVDAGWTWDSGTNILTHPADREINMWIHPLTVYVASHPAFQGQLFHWREMAPPASPQRCILPEMKDEAFRTSFLLIAHSTSMLPLGTAHEVDLGRPYIGVAGELPHLVQSTVTTHL